MEYIKNTLNFETRSPSVITLGKFDGVHLGHRKLINRILEIGKRDGLLTVIFTFDASPQVTLGYRKPQTLLSNEERRQRIESFGVDTLIECPFVPQIRNMEPEEFITQILVKKLQVKAVVVGSDFHFGKNRRGNPFMLSQMGKKYGFAVEVLNKVKDGGREVSSTYIREELLEGHMEKVHMLLGYPYMIIGDIIHGHKLGRQIGMPTINQVPKPEKLLPPRGVYASVARIDGQEFYGVSNIGIKPTVQEKFVGVETYLFDCDLDLYGKEACVCLLHYQRPEVKFDSIEELRIQMNKDKEIGKKYFGMSQ
ncbi:bifunctional riboflavin kinase/FAD synthetase [Blautia liquoris]|uniref:Riboflavin biosynthesis protein n=1 Tax=Blautia liquoris TaxID=2779518 RepID=A0A7M2RDA4_9FIRM|nr:bifunctional riboflavin kinase/FAD synthetase [Blautia liquoris]QOV18299.1 bifunctional riboflavin kinase/FAD synthetase [Blautia liquoris]